ncbi:carbonic anhydrase [Micromonospora sp. KC606]|uniref:carbonic anhydrase n=1 Tax=Micromonospora sp. KC606 TaxID=2530379 RepID=UPI00104D79F0|nr:carbonic anhydrase [Micromonospora sp. KC606]TDC83075.1 carbonic anhydrase [Micromonospora sp. KC606]
MADTSIFAGNLHRRNVLRLLMAGAGSAVTLAACSSTSDSGTAATTTASAAPVALASAAPVAVADEQPVTTPRQAIDRLMRGNVRFVSGQMRHPHLSPDYRAQLAKGQHPFAQVLTCADSRVAPEFVFDQGLGDLFVERNAGNIAEPVVVGSMQYAVHELKVPLILVLGHQKCGAVTAAVEAVENNSQPTGTDLDAIINAIRPAVEKVKHSGGDIVDKAVRQHVADMVAKLRAKPVLQPAIRAGALQVIGGRYTLDSGKVDIIVQ